MAVETLTIESQNFVAFPGTNVAIFTLAGVVIGKFANKTIEFTVPSPGNHGAMIGTPTVSCSLRSFGTTGGGGGDVAAVDLVHDSLILVDGSFTVRVDVANANTEVTVFRVGVQAIAFYSVA
jgi:hypothetical protein